MNKGYAFGFLIVILVVILGFYVAFTGFRSSRETLSLQATPDQSTEGVPVSPTVPPSPSPPPTPTPVASIELTATVAVTPPLAVAPVPPDILVTKAPVSSPTPASTVPVVEAVASQTPLPQPATPAPVPAYAFRLGGPPVADPSYPICCYIYGTVRDAAGNGLEGIWVQAANEWTTLDPAVTKGGDELGKYDIPINTEIVKWYVKLVDVQGNQISSEVQIQFDASATNAYRLDWQRTY